MTVHALAPASTANLGPAFDCAAAALELWNEVVVDESDRGGIEIEGEGAAELPRDASHLTLRAFALFAPPERYRFRFVNRIPLERGLGSSAAAIALGLVAGSAVAGSSADPGELLPHAVRLEGHADNLAAALLGGVCVAWCERRRRARRADRRRPAARVGARRARRRERAPPSRAMVFPTRSRMQTPPRTQASPRCSAPRSPPVTRSSCARPSTTGCTSSTVPATLRCSARSARARPTARSV